MKILINGQDSCDFERGMWMLGYRGWPEVQQSAFTDDWEATLCLGELMGDPGYKRVDVVQQ